MTKTCSTCRIEQSVENFSKNKSKKDGLSYQCNSCRADYRQRNKEAIKKYDAALVHPQLSR